MPLINLRCFKKIEYCPGNGFELLFASVVMAVGYDTLKGFYTRDSRLELYWFAEGRYGTTKKQAEYACPKAV